VIDILVALWLGKYQPIFTSPSKTTVIQCKTYNVLRTFECPAWLTIRTRESDFLTKKSAVINNKQKVRQLSRNNEHNGMWWKNVANTREKVAPSLMFT